MGKLQRIDELTTPPVVGQRYLVPTVVYPWSGVRKAWPVMGPRHEDGEHIGFHHQHYHVDIRFVSRGDAERIAGSAGDIGAHAAHMPLSTRGEPEHPDPVWKPRICHRTGNDYPYGEQFSAGFIPKLRGAYAGRRCGKNAAGLLVCPHKGFVLNSLQPDANGRVICPLHGLVIDVAAEVVIEAAGGARG